MGSPACPGLSRTRSWHPSVWDILWWWVLLLKALPWVPLWVFVCPKVWISCYINILLLVICIIRVAPGHTFSWREGWEGSWEGGIRDKESRKINVLSGLDYRASFIYTINIVWNVDITFTAAWPGIWLFLWLMIKVGNKSLIWLLSPPPLQTPALHICKNAILFMQSI